VPVKIVPVAQHISFGNKFTLCFHKQNYYMFYRHANVQRTYISLSLTNLSSCCPQCWKMSCSASSIAARKYLTNYLRRKFSCTLQEIFVISSTGMAYHLYLLFTKAICKSRLSCAKIEAYHIVQHHWSFLFDLYTGNFYFWILLPGRQIYYLGLVVLPLLVLDAWLKFV
jgi:hypothetical protein